MVPSILGDPDECAGVILATTPEDSMSFTRSIAGAATVVLLAMLPAVAGAQERMRTACNDGTRTPSIASNACDLHGGVHKGNTAFLRRQPGSATKSAAPDRVTQAGSPAPARTTAPAPDKPRYEERRGWRWRRHHDESRREENEREKERRYRCRDGKMETVHGKAKGREVCKHHGGIAR